MSNATLDTTAVRRWKRYPEYPATADSRMKRGFQYEQRHVGRT